MPSKSPKAKSGCCSIDDLNLPEDLQKELDSRGGLESVVQLVPERGYLNYEAEQFHSLSDPIRLQIMYALQVCDLCPCIIKRITGLSDSKLSYHLSILEQGGLISSRQHKNWRIYSLTDMGRSHLRQR